LNPTINKKVIMGRIAIKIHKAIGRMGFLPATGTQGVLRYGDRIMLNFKVDREQCAGKKEYVN
jgi:hypothetical protein